ncbi:MAG: MlaD family protein [Geminicoccaceae bacterium]
MNRGVSPRLIGLFVLGAIVLGILGALALGGSELFLHGSRYTIYFDESLKGLRRGSPLTFRGVDIGQVVEIRAVYEPATRTVHVPVIVEIRPGSVVLDDDVDRDGSAMTGLIKEGLRARLDLQSLLTGQLLIALDFFPGPVNAGSEAIEPGTIPSVPSTLATFQRTADSALMELPEITRSLREVASALQRFLSDSNRQGIQDTIASLSVLARSLGDPEGPAQRTLAELPSLVGDLRQGAAQITPVLQHLDGLATSGDARLQALGDQLARVSESAAKAADQAAALMRENRRGLNEFVDDGLPQMQGFVEDATRLVNELSSTIRDLRQDPTRFFLGDRARQGVQLK